MKILGTGLNGLVGSRIVELLSPKYTFQNISRSNGFDITDYSSIVRLFSESEASVVLHAAAYTDVKAAEKEKDLKEESEAYKINVIGTKNVAQACRETGKKIVFISTDLVLGGDQMPEGGFKEDSEPNPLSWYAQTKYRAEEVVKEVSAPFLIIRIAYPYRASYEKLDFVRFFKKLLDENNNIDVLVDRIFTPTFIDDIVFAFSTLVEQEKEGIYHVAGSEILSMYDAVSMIADEFGLDKSLIGKTTREEFLVNRPPEPFYSALNNDKIMRLGVKMSTFSEGLKKIKEQGFK